LVLSPTLVARGIWVAIGVLLLTTLWGLSTLSRAHLPWTFLAGPAPRLGLMPALFGLALVLVSVGGGDALAREAHEFLPPRVPSLRRTGLFVAVLGILAIAVPALLFDRLIPESEWTVWTGAPL